MLLAAALVAALDVLDVDSAQGPYFEIRDAVAAASPGDVVRVAPGTYGWFGVFGKSLTVHALGVVDVDGTVRVQNLAPGDIVVLDGLRVDADATSGDPAFIAAGCQGAVRIQGCEFTGSTGLAARIVDCVDVTLHHSTAVAGASYSTFFGGYFSASALEVTDSSVTLWDSSAVGSDASVWGVDGGHGVEAFDSALFLHGATARGGQGGPDDWSQFLGVCRPAGYGGDGVHAHGGATRILDSTLVGGPEGPAWNCGGFAGPGQPVSSNGTVTMISGDALEFDCDGLVLEGTALPLSAAGAPFDTILLVVGPETGRVTLPAYVGDLHVGGPLGAARRALLGVGSVATQLQMPLLPPLGVERYYLQTAHLRGGQVVFGPTRSVTILDSAW